jgi:hypothetical protein
MRSTTVAVPQILSDASPESETPKNAWCSFLAAHLDYFANLVWYLVADSMLIERVMVRAVSRLENMHFNISDAQKNYTRARGVLIGEAVTQLNQLREAVAKPMSNPCLPPDFPRLAFLLKRCRNPRSSRSLPEETRLG